MQYVIGLDIGTTCTKAVVVSGNGEIVGQGSSGYGLIPVGAGVEQRAEDWIYASVAAIKEATKDIDTKCICGISCSTQGGSTVGVLSDGSFIGNAWTWMDRRSTAQASDAEQKLGLDYIYRTTGSKIGPALDLAKLPNMQSLPEYADAAVFYTTLEVINHFLTGNGVIDPTNAALRQLMNIDTQQWDARILQTIGASAQKLPEIVPTGKCVGTLVQKAAEELGLPEGVPVFNGAHDQYCASVGSGAIHPGDMLLSAGTTWVLMGITQSPLYTNSYIVPGRHPIDGLYGAFASLVGSGASMQWFKNNFLSTDFDQMNREVPLRKESAKELFFFPYLNGAPFPIHNPNAKGVFAGITLQHDQYDFARAIMEGVAFGVRRATEDFVSNGAQIKSILMMGGAAKSPAWMQMISSVTSLPIYRLNCPDVCAMGAAMIAGVGAGLFDGYQDAVDRIVSVEHIYQPDSEEQAYYEEKYSRFSSLWNHLNAYYKGE